MASFELTTTDQKILAKLANVTDQFKQLEEKMNDPAVASNPQEITTLAKEHGKLRPMVESYLEFQSMNQQYQDAMEMLEDDDTDSRDERAG